MSAAREDEADVEVLAEDTHGQAATTAVSEVTYSEEADTTMAGTAHGTEEDTAMAVHTHSTEEDTALAEVTHIEFDVSGQGEAQEDESEEVVLDADVARFEPRSDLPHGQGDVFDQRSMVTNHLRRENGKQIHLDPALESHETDLDELDPVYFYSRETTGVLSSIRDRGKSGKARVYRASEVSGAVVAGAHGRKCDTFYQPDDDDPVGSVPTALGDHAAVDVSLEDPDLVQFQARIQHHAIATTSRKTDEVVSLWDPGANRSFISSRLVLEYNLPITRHLSKIKNGDGSEAVSPGYVTVTIHMGRFQAKVTLIVAPLSVYDFIMGFDLIKAHKVRLDFDPLRLSGISGGKAGKRVPIPTCVLSRRSPDGRDISTYTDEMPLKADNNHLQHEDPSWQEAFAVLPGESASDLLLYHGLHQELLELAESTAGAEDFRARATAWLHQKRSLDDFAEPGKKSSERARAEQVAQDDSSDLSAPLGELGEKEKVFRQRIVADYPHLCSDTLPEDGPSATWPNGEAYEVHLELKEGCTPEKRKQFRIPEAMREELEKTIEDLIKFKLIEPSISQYNSPVFLVPKPPLKDGSFNGFRFVYDGRGVNKALKFDTYNIPRVEDMIERIARLKFEAERAGVTNMIISCLDQRTSFWQLKLAPECRHLTAFSTSTGVYQWCALPMGILTSSAHLQRFSQALLQPFSASNVFEYETTDERGLPVTRRAYGTAIAYIDDIAVCTFGSVEDHEVLLRRVLARMEHCNLRLQPKKCEFFRSQVDFLGHVLSADGIRQQDRKVAAIKNWPPLTVVTSIRAFCSMCSYYRRFVKDFAAIARPLTDLLRKDAVIKPLPAEAEEAFEQLKTALCTAPVLAYFNVHADTQLHIDASGYGIGAVLSQTDVEGVSRPVGFYSRRLSDAEMKYCTYDRELLGLKEAVLHFQYQLLGIPFKVWTDHCSLRWLLTQSQVSNLQARWAAIIGMFRITEIAHVPGKDNVTADALSRYPDPNGPSYADASPADSNMEVRFSHHANSVEESALTDSHVALRKVTSEKLRSGFPEQTAAQKLNAFSVAMQLLRDTAHLNRVMKKADESIRRRKANQLSKLHSQHPELKSVITNHADLVKHASGAGEEARKLKHFCKESDNSVHWQRQITEGHTMQDTIMDLAVKIAHKYHFLGELQFLIQEDDFSYDTTQLTTMIGERVWAGVSAGTVAAASQSDITRENHERNLLDKLERDFTGQQPIPADDVANITMSELNKDLSKYNKDFYFLAMADYAMHVLEFVVQDVEGHYPPMSLVRAYTPPDLKPSEGQDWMSSVVEILWNQYGLKISIQKSDGEFANRKRTLTSMLRAQREEMKQIKNSATLADIIIDMTKLVTHDEGGIDLHRSDIVEDTLLPDGGWHVTPAVQVELDKLRAWAYARKCLQASIEMSKNCDPNLGYSICHSKKRPVILRPFKVRFHADEPEDGVEQPKHSSGRKRLRRHNSDYHGPVMSGPAPSSLPIRQLNGCAANKVSRPANAPPVIDLTVNRACAAAASLANTADNVVYIALPPRPNKKRKRGDAGPDEIDETSIMPRTPLWLERRPVCTKEGFENKNALGASSFKYTLRRGCDEAYRKALFGYTHQKNDMPDLPVEAQRACEHGTEHEDDGTATLKQNVGSYLRRRFPGCTISHIQIRQTGLYTLPPPDNYLKCTPDLYFTFKKDGITQPTINVEIKCPWYGEDGKTAHCDRNCRPDYILHTHFEMKALVCSETLLVSWGPETTRVFPIKFSSELFQDMSEWSKRWFTSDSCPTLGQTTCVERIKEATQTIAAEASKRAVTWTSCVYKR